MRGWKCLTNKTIKHWSLSSPGGNCHCATALHLQFIGVLNALKYLDFNPQGAFLKKHFGLYPFFR
ncbi:hypothetical protein GCM10025776_05350 [Corallincola platygyrae]